MVKVHTSDGQTHELDLSDSTQARDWVSRFQRRDFQRSITAITVVERHSAGAKCPTCGVRLSTSLGVASTVVRPEGYRSVGFNVEDVDIKAGGERVTVFADDAKLTLMSHAGRPATRLSLTKFGRRQFNPFEPSGRS